MKYLLGALTAVSVLLFVTPVGAHVVQAMSSVSLADVDVESPELRQALEDEVNGLIRNTIAFRPTLVALTDLQVIGQRLYFRVLIADEEGERTLNAINAAERPAVPTLDRSTATLRTLL